MGASSPGALTRADIQAWDVTHLETAAAHWTATAQEWESHFEAIHSGVLRPGGTAWEGAGADAAAERTWGDLVTVRSAANALHAAAGHATTAVGDIPWAKRQVQNAIGTAEKDGFTVGQDFSVRDTRMPSLLLGTEDRQSKATAHAHDIRAALQQLVSIDRTTGDRITAALAPLGQLSFPEDGTRHDPAVKAVDYHRPKESPQDKAGPDSKDQPGGKPADASEANGGLAGLLGVDDNATPKPGDGQPPAAAPPKLDPSNPETKAAVTAMRDMLARQGVPRDQIEQQINAFVAKSQQPLPAPPKPDTAPMTKPPAPSLGEQLGEKFNNFINDAHDQFYNRLDSTVNTLQNLTGTGGEGHPGVAESWEQLGKTQLSHLAQDPLHLRDPMGPLGPIGALNSAVHDIPEMVEHPGKYFGDKLFDGTAAASTAPLGGEGLLGRAMLPEVGALERGVAPGAAHALEYGPAPVVPHPVEPPLVPHVIEPPAAPRAVETPLVPHSAQPVVPHDADPPAGHHSPAADMPVEHPAPVPDPSSAHHVPEPVQAPLFPPPDAFDPHQGMHYNSGDPYHPGGWPPSTPDPTWTRGDTTPGWEYMNRGPEKPWMPYQEQISGIERTPDGRIPEYVLVDPDTGTPVRMDSGPIMRGDQEVFLDAKREYAPLFKDPDAPWTANIREGLVNEAQRQLNALPDGAILEWHVANPQSAAIMRDLLESRGLLDVRVIYTPEKR